MNGIPDVRTLVLQLPEKERADLAHQLLLSLEPEMIDDDIASAWEAEIDSRLKKIAEGKHIAHDWRQALQDIRQEIN